MVFRQGRSFHQRLIIAFAFALTLGVIVAGGVLAWLNVRAQAQTAAVVIRTHRVLGVLDEIETTMTDAETGQRGYLLAGDERFLEPYLAATGRGAVPIIERPPISTLLASARALALPSRAERDLLDRIDGLARDKLAELRQTIELRRAGRADAALAIVREGRGKRSMDALRATLVEMRDEERRQLEASDAQRRQAVHRAYLSSTVGCVVALLAILLLVGAGRRVQRDLAGHQQALLDANRRKDEFIATLAHELRNPLAPIQAGLELMRISPAFPLPLSRTREIMSRQLAHLVRLIDDLLDVSRISSGKLELQRKRIQVRDVVERALESHRARIEQAGHTLEPELASEPLTVDGDPVRLAQVLGNLLDNAAKYTPDGGRIRLEARREGGDAVIRVRDNGIGIDPTMLAQVFDLFAQAPDARARRQGGIGIGLAIARRLAAMHGGTLEADSAGPGQGSTFTLRLPLAQAQEEPATPPPRAPAHAMRAGARRILILDDNLDAAQTLGNLLGLAGHTVQLAHTGREAIDLAGRFQPDLAFLDIGLPDMTGYDVARAMRRQPALREARLVALTGWGAAADRKKSREAGIDLHLTKPVSLEALAEALPGLALPSSEDA